MRITTLGCAFALALLASEALLTFGVVAQTAAVTMDGGAPAAPVRPASIPLPTSEQDPAARSARSIECAQKADAQGLLGKTRKHFLHECKRTI